ncbi:MAG: hypothetical protein AXW14_18250 [Alteromonas sp. Nap_26]|nr:MAG: hypothetical protein AXW14_18250 [Alteromonas sp. Nap_26]
MSKLVLYIFYAIALVAKPSKILHKPLLLQRLISVFLIQFKFARLQIILPFLQTVLALRWK